MGGGESANIHSLRYEMNDLAMVGQLFVRDKEFSSLQSVQHLMFAGPCIIVITEE